MTIISKALAHTHTHGLLTHANYYGNNKKNENKINMHVLCCCCWQIECDAISQRAFAVRVHSLAHDLLSSLLLLALSRSQIHNTLSLTLCAHFKASQKVDNAFIYFIITSAVID